MSNARTLFLPTELLTLINEDSGKCDQLSSTFILKQLVILYKDKLISRYGKEVYDELLKKYNMTAIEQKKAKLEKEKQKQAIREEKLKLRRKSLELKEKELAIREENKEVREFKTIELPKTELENRLKGEESHLEEHLRNQGTADAKHIQWIKNRINNLKQQLEAYEGKD